MTERASHASAENLPQTKVRNILDTTNQNATMQGLTPFLTPFWYSDPLTFFRSDPFFAPSFCAEVEVVCRGQSDSNRHLLVQIQKHHN